jgi:S-adenosylmethionine/arginine decarboxylase-like enzyme
MGPSREWIVDAFDCAAPRIAGETGREALMSLFANVIRSVNLHPVGQAVWQIMPAGAVTGMVALVESHLTCHSDPALGFLSLNLLSNRTDVTPDFEGLLSRFVGARRIEVRVLDRGVGAAATAPATAGPAAG